MLDALFIFWLVCVSYLVCLLVGFDCFVVDLWLVCVSFLVCLLVGFDCVFVIPAQSVAGGGGGLVMFLWFRASVVHQSMHVHHTWTL